MQRKIDLVAKNEKEAIALAVNEFHVPEQKIFVSVLGENLDGSLNCEALLDVNLSFEGKKYIEGVLKALQVKYQIETRTVGNEKEIHYLIESDHNALLIGKNGATMNALLTLVRRLITNYSNEKIITTLDVGTYRTDRDRQLEILATKTAKTVIKTKVEAKLKPMNAYERHIIHEKLGDWRDVYTESEGTGEDRAVVIKLRNK